MVPHSSTPSSNGMTKHVNLHWDDVKSLTHTKHHLVLVSGIGSNLRKRRLCVGTSRVRDTFELLASHQKMAFDLRTRKLFIRSDCVTLPRTKCRPVSYNETAEKIKNDLSKSLPSMSPVLARRYSNAVRIYVPYSEHESQTTADYKSSGRSEPANSDTTDGHLPPSSPVNWQNSLCSSDISTLDAIPTSPRKSTLVRMGTKISSDALIREKLRLQEGTSNTPSERAVSTEPPSGAYVLGNDILDDEFDSDEWKDISYIV